MLARVTDGLFFSKPTPLPRGRHGLPRQQALTAQRERLMAAMAELMAEHGYAAVRVGDIARTAAVSRASFYECFAGKEACAFAAYDRFIDVLMGRVVTNLHPTQGVEAYVTGALEGYLGALEDDPVVGRAFLLEIDAIGAPARERRHRSLLPFAEMIRRQHQLVARTDDTLRPLPLSGYRAIVHGIRQIACDALDESRTPDLRGLIPETSVWILAMLRGNLGAAASADSRATLRARRRARPAARSASA